jgi:hypothetical protein
MPLRPFKDSRRRRLPRGFGNHSAATSYQLLPGLPSALEGVVRCRRSRFEPALSVGNTRPAVSDALAEEGCPVPYASAQELEEQESLNNTSMYPTAPPGLWLRITILVDYPPLARPSFRPPQSILTCGQDFAASFGDIRRVKPSSRSSSLSLSLPTSHTFP